MNNPTPKILFISHDASRLGAPIVLLNLLRRIKEIGIFEFDVLFINGGVLEKEFNELSTIFIWNKDRKKTIFNRIFNRLTSEKYKERHKKRYIATFSKKNYELIYANTIVSAELAIILQTYSPQTKLLLHIHELDFNIRSIVGFKKFSDQILKFDHIIAVCDAVKQNILENYKVNENNVSIIYPFSDQTGNPQIELQKKIKTELGITPETFVVGASGYVQWRKGPDVFIDLAKRFFIKNPTTNCIFIWIGEIPEYEKLKIEFDLQKLFLTDKVKFLGEKTNPADYFSIFDVVTMVSREDPFPLICMECASLSKPIICFEDAGGMPEFVKNDAGFVVPYLDVESMAEKIQLLNENEILKIELGKNAFQKLQLYFSKEKSITEIISVMNKCVK